MSLGSDTFFTYLTTYLLTDEGECDEGMCDYGECNYDMPDNMYGGTSILTLS